MSGPMSDLGAKHERLKKRIHAFRIPLGPTGRRIMNVVYIGGPVLLGYALMEYYVAPARERNLKSAGIRSTQHSAPPKREASDKL